MVRYWAAVLLVSFGSSNAVAANWPMLQGTEEGRAETALQPFGFIQPSYEVVFADPVSGLESPDYSPYNGDVAAFNTLGPGDETATFRLSRARVGLRGTIPETERRVNYLMTIGAGQNALVGDAGAVLVDASATLNTPWFRVRAGQFKLPLVDEATESVLMTLDTVKFSNVVETLLFERPYSNGAFSGQAYGFRDLGVMVFDAHLVDKLELSYAFWITNGQMNHVDVNDGVDVGVWTQVSWLLDEQRFKPERDEISFYAFGLTGDRYDDTTTAKARTRAGMGIQLRKDSVRLRTEAVYGHGAIPAGNSPPFRGQPVVAFDGDAGGVTALVGYRMLKWLELDASFHHLRLFADSGSDSLRSEAVLGIQAFASPKAKLTLNGILPWRSVEDASADLNRILDSAAPRIVVQATIAY